MAEKGGGGTNSNATTRRWSLCVANYMCTLQQYILLVYSHAPTYSVFVYTDGEVWPGKRGNISCTENTRTHIYNNITHCHVLLAWVGGGDTRGEAGTYFTRYIMLILCGTQKSLLYYSTNIM